MAKYYVTYKSEDILHYGILGMRWGVRRFQNEDGSLTPAGRKRYIRDIQNYPMNGTISNTTKGIANKLLLGAAYTRRKPEEVAWTSSYGTYDILYTVIDNHIDKIEKNL